MKGSDAIIECLRKEGVEKIFGYPGGAVTDIYDSLRAESSIEHILTRHEQGAAHAADAYARVSGKVGVCLATSGPGATNLTTGIATAYMDSVPLVALTGQVPTDMIGNDVFQEADITGITMPITKYNFLVKEVDKIPVSFKKAFQISASGRKGPVLIDLPKDVQNDDLDFEYPENVEIKGYDPTYKGHPLQIRKVAEAIFEAERPVILAGGGVVASGASGELGKLVDRTMIPVTTTLMGKGCFDEDHPLSLGMLGIHGTKAANYAVSEADLLVAVGARFDDRAVGEIESFAENAKVVHIDIDPAEIGKNVKAHIPIVGDAKNCLSALNDEIEATESKKCEGEWHERVEKWKGEFVEYGKGGEDRIKPQYVVEKIDEGTDDDTIITTEVGQCQMWTAQYYRFKKPGTMITSGGLGTMGYGLPAAIGAQVAKPEGEVWNIAGDGSIQMNIQELATAVNNDLPVNIAILNNRYLGMVRQLQEFYCGGRYTQVDLEKNPDFVKIAKGYGADGMVVEDEDDVEEAVEAAHSSDLPFVLDFRVEREENVYPTVPSGYSLSELMDGKGGD